MTILSKIINNNFRLALWLTAILCLPLAAVGQKTSKNQGNKGSGKNSQSGFTELRHQSKLMSREMPYRIIFPAGYAREKQKRYPVIYLLHGRVGHYNDWTDKAKVVEYAKPYDFIIVMPEGGSDGWYSDSVIKPDDKYESYFIQELIPEIDSHYRTLANRENRVVAGLSMGGYGALKFGLKYPEKFILAGSFSGALDSVFRTEKYPHLIKSVKDVFGENDNPSRRENNIFRLVEAASPEQIKQMPFLFIDCGTEDHQFQSNRDFVALLTDKKVPHEYRQKPGAHTWDFWDAEIQEFLRVAGRIVWQKKQSSGS